MNAILAALLAVSIGVEKAKLGTLPAKTMVVTNVTLDASGLVDTNAVKSIIETEVGGTNTLVHTAQIADFVTKAVTNVVGSQARAALAYPMSAAFTNDVASVVTNEVSVKEWFYSGDVISGATYTLSSFEEEGEYIYSLYENGQFFDVSQGHSTPQTIIEFHNEERSITATLVQLLSNALGLARLTDIPSTNGFVTASVTNVVAAEVRGKANAADVYTKVAADTLFAPTSTAVAVASKIGSAEAQTIAESVFSTNADYALTNLAANTETFSLGSGRIGNLSLDSSHTNINLTLLYPSANDRAADILLRVINAADTLLSVDMAATDVDGTEWMSVKAGTNYIMATRTAYDTDASKSKVLISVKEVK